MHIAVLLPLIGAMQASGTTAIIALDASPLTATVTTTLAQRRSDAGDKVIAARALSQLLGGPTTERDIDDDAVMRMLADARQREAYFDTAGARAMRQQIGSLLSRAVRPSVVLRQATASAAFDEAAALLAAGDANAAQSALERALFLHGDRLPDEKRYPPQFRDLLARRLHALQSVARTNLTIVADRGGNLFAWGAALGHTDGALTVSLVPGTYRLWLQWDDGSSRPYDVVVGKERQSVRIDAGLDQRLSVQRDAVVLACAQDCPDLLARLARRVGADTAHGIGALRVAGYFRELAVHSESIETTERTTDADGREVANVDAAASGLGYARFELGYLLPFGGAQLVQHRPVAGAVYAAIQASLLGSYLYHRDLFLSARAGGLDRSQETYRQRANVSLALFGVAVGAAVVEALAVGYFAAEADESR
ncbi:MAG: hypothetical protein AAB426_06030 [Myxococcota bacterium]